jgi:RecB family endonuclease NucS
MIIETPIEDVDKESVSFENCEDVDDIDDTIETNFTYERDLQSALIQQIDKLFPEHRIFGSINEGKEYSIDGKRIDILLENKTSNELLVIELKAGLAKKEVLGQIAEYLGKLSRKFPNNQINGLIIAGEIDESLKDACRPFPNIKTKKYKIELSIIE